jgi:hypothetical protein
MPQQNTQRLSVSEYVGEVMLQVHPQRLAHATEPITVGRNYLELPRLTGVLLAPSVARWRARGCQVPVCFKQINKTKKKGQKSQAQRERKKTQSETETCKLQVSLNTNTLVRPLLISNWQAYKTRHKEEQYKQQQKNLNQE